VKSKTNDSYNERLFSGGFRKYLHLSRYYWLQRELICLKCACDSVIEIGCFDGKLIEFLPGDVKRYCGYDANWEGGLDIALEKWKQFPQYEFRKAISPKDMALTDADWFDIAVIMETLEHLALELVDGYLRKVGGHLRQYIFITVPNEKGIVFLSKWLVKAIFYKDARQYSFVELMYATLGRMEKVKRREHKGFDYSALIREVEKYYDIIDVSGIPFGFLPPSLNYGVGIVARVKEDALNI
jgi:2-polyprenyl-3-methyl-5-hydroxy-6-metoxy-1,4-benzoquinol methylase